MVCYNYFVVQCVDRSKTSHQFSTGYGYAAVYVKCQLTATCADLVLLYIDALWMLWLFLSPSMTEPFAQGIIVLGKKPTKPGDWLCLYMRLVYSIWPRFMHNGKPLLSASCDCQSCLQALVHASQIKALVNLGASKIVRLLSRLIENLRQRDLPLEKELYACALLYCVQFILK